MQKITKNDYLFGLDDIDVQHGQLINLIEDTLEAYLEKNKSQPQLIKIVEELKQYAKVHFSFEENLLDFFNYPELNQHIKLHNQFNEKIKLLEKRIKIDDSVMITEVLIFMRDWLLNHINIEDRKYVPFLQEHIKSK